MKDSTDDHFQRMSNALNWLRSAPPSDDLVEALVLICLRDNAKDYASGFVPEKHLQNLIDDVEQMMAQIGLLSLSSKGMAKICMKSKRIRFKITETGKAALKDGGGA